MGDTNPVYTDAGAAARSVHGGPVAPPAMTQVWTMRGLRPARGEEPGDPRADVGRAGRSGSPPVVATNSEQEYYRYLRPGEQVTVRSSLEEVTGPKRTALGEGWFVTTRSTWYVGIEAVASMMFRILKFRPAAQSGPPVTEPSAQLEPPALPEPPAAAGGRRCRRAAAGRLTGHRLLLGKGTARHELRIQRCGACGALRHPPGPMCQVCGFARPEYDVAAGTGEVYSYVVHQHPPVPGRSLPIVIALVALAEGVRMVGELLDISPERARIGLPVRVTFVEVDGELTLPAWREDRRWPPGGSRPGNYRPARAGDRRHPDVRDRRRDRDQGLPGRPPRP